jgi:4a-hydroxytetrahydrobiopterin dehydratase
MSVVTRNITHRALQTASRLPVVLLALRGQVGYPRMLSSHTTSKSSIDDGVSSIIYSDNQPESLPHHVSNLTAWTVTPSKMGLTRQFTFPTFAAAWRFMSLVAEECKTKRHHPSWHNLYNQVTIEWTTHRPKGLSIKDAEMAEFCDHTAEHIGLQTQTRGDGTGNSGVKSATTA